MKTYSIYSDGSHFKNGNGSGRLGIGSLLVYNDKVIDTISIEIDEDKFSTKYGTNDFSNPTMEIYAIYESLNKWKDLFSKENCNIISYSDYIGASKWINGEWKINKPYIRLIFNDIRMLINEYKLNIEFRWIRGHSNDKYNDMADSLAKGLNIYGKV